MDRKKRRACLLSTLEERFWKKVELIPFHSCWEWIGAKHTLGYGRISVGTKNTPAHRVSYELHYNIKIPNDYDVDHLCRNPGCVRPEHLEPVTHKVNMERGIQATKTHCKYGHPRTKENLYTDKNGQRGCKICRAIKNNSRPKKGRLFLMCKRGHKRDEVGFYQVGKNKICKKCHNIRVKIYKKKKRSN